MSELQNRKIVLLLEGLELGGSERQALLLAEHLIHEQQAQVEIWAFHSAGRAAVMCTEKGIPWRIVPMSLGRGWLRSLRRMAQLALLLRRAGVEVLLPYTTWPNIVSGLVWRPAGVRWSAWNQRNHGILRVHPFIERLAMQLLPWGISNSQHGADFMVDKLGARPERISVIYNGVQLPSPALDRAGWRSQLGVGPGTFLACMLANVSKYKDHATLLQAWAKARSCFSQPAILLLAGRKADAYESVRTLAGELNVEESLRFLGSVEDVSGLLHAVDLGVYSARAEGLTNGVLESMAAGLAVAGTDIPGLREVVGPQGYPYLAPPGDANSLAERIVQLAQNEVLRLQIGQANRLRVQQEFSHTRMFRQMVDLIAQGLNK
jgi:glycosyltransferase involved in cell wall biosynthesis